jgi:hypothetical protein
MHEASAMSNTNNEQMLPTPLIWTSGDWVAPAQSEPPYNGLQFLFSPVYDKETHKLMTLNVEIQDCTYTQTGSRQSTTFSRVADGARVQIHPASPVSPPTSEAIPTAPGPMAAPDTTDAIPEQPAEQPAAKQAGTDRPDDAERALPPSREASQTPEPVADGSTDSVSSEPDDSVAASNGNTGNKPAGFTVLGNLELRFTQDSPGKVVVIASLIYGLPSQRHHVQGGLKEIPLTSASPVLPDPS